MDLPQVKMPHLMWHPGLRQTSLSPLAWVSTTRVRNFIAGFVCARHIFVLLRLDRFIRSLSQSAKRVLLTEHSPLFA